MVSLSTLSLPEILLDQPKINRLVSYRAIKERCMGYWNLSNRLVQRRRSTHLPSMRENLLQIVLKDSALIGKYANKKYILEMVISKGDLNFYICATGRTRREAFKDFRFRYKYETDLDYKRVVSRLVPKGAEAPVGSIRYNSQEQEFQVRVSNTGNEREDWRLLKEDGTYQKKQDADWGEWGWS